MLHLSKSTIYSVILLEENLKLHVITYQKIFKQRSSEKST